MENKRYKLMGNASRGIQVAIDGCAGSHVRLKQKNKDLERSSAFWKEEIKRILERGRVEKQRNFVK